MNAVLRERDEIRMVANETIEAHIAFLRVGLEDVKHDVRKLSAESTPMLLTLRDKIDQSHAMLSAGQATQRDRIDDTGKELHAKIDGVEKNLNRKIDAVNKDLTEKIEAVDKTLGQKIDAVNKDLTQKIDAVNQKIDNLSTAFAELRGFHKTVLWVCGAIVTAVTVILGVGKALGWF